MKGADESSRLLSRIERRFQIVSTVYRIGPLQLPFTRVSDPDRVLDDVVAEQDRLDQLTGRRDDDVQHLPYWAELWDSAFGVAQFIARERLEQSHRALSSGTTRRARTLDLGCGMGLAGAAAATLGDRVLLVDLEPDALLFARLNTLRFGPRCRTRRLDWQTDQLDERFDLILGADVLYERAQWPFLEPFWQRHLALGGGVLLAEPGRQTGDLFIDWINGRGWSLESFSEPIVTRATPIRLFRLTRAM